VILNSGNWSYWIENMSKNQSKSSDSTTEPGSSDAALKWAELLLKQRELDDKSHAEKRGLWFTSPVLIAVVAGVLSLIGAGIGSAIQNFWSIEAEQKKFEFSLIQKALDTPNKKEAAIRLLFLVETGVLTILDDERIRRAANTPNTLPTYGRLTDLCAFNNVVKCVPAGQCSGPSAIGLGFAIDPTSDVTMEFSCKKACRQRAADNRTFTCETP
jgi:hypothetical protein